MAALNGKSALVTGGSRGIGAAIAKRLAKEGADVAITYSSSRQRAQEVVDDILGEGGRAVAIKADAADQAAVRAAVQQVAQEFGKIDILVNNAGMLAFGPIEDFPVKDFETVPSVNVRSVFTATQKSMRHMPDGGRIITIGAVNSERVPVQGASVYALTKGVVATFTKGLARDLGDRKITVNNIQPGPVDTESNPASGPFADTMPGFMAVKRYGHADEIAALTAYLAGPEAGYITGASLLIDGGFAA